MSQKRNIGGRQLSGRYTLLSLIAQGGMGEVWKARDQITGQLVAAKVLRAELTGEEISLSRLRLEATNAMRAKHPNIAAVLDSGEDDNQGWIVMELVEGEPLTKYVGDGKTLAPAELIPLLTQTAYALDSAARAGVVHRDIKPANIIVRPDGMVKLTDFGVSLASGQANLTAAGMVMGTAQYLPPEQAMGQVATPVGDLYSLGVIAFEALAGHRPYTGKTQVDIAFAHVNETIPTLPSFVEEPMAELVYRLLSKDPKLRPQTGAALARELVAVASSLGVETAPKSLLVTGDKTPRPAAFESAGSGSVGISPVGIGSADSDVASAPISSVNTAPVGGPASPVPPVVHVHRKHLPEATTQSWHPVDTDVVRKIPRASAKRPRPWAPDPAELSPDRNISGSDQSQGTLSQAGPWIIGALVALTLILIVIAMVRNYAPSPQASDFTQTISSLSQLQEVEPWLNPVADV